MITIKNSNNKKVSLERPNDIDVRDGGARGAMAPPGKNLSRANVSPGQYKSHCIRKEEHTMQSGRLLCQIRRGFSKEI